MAEHEHFHAPRPPQAGDEQRFDAGTTSLARALRLSFSGVKLVMLLLVAGYLLSGFYTVAPDELAVRLHFGRAVREKVSTAAAIEASEAQQGAHWAWPFPIDEIVKIKGYKGRELEIGTFWYSTPLGRGEEALRALREQQRVLPKAEKVRGQGGACLTGDQNILHFYWTVQYTIQDAVLYLRNVAGIDMKDPSQMRWREEQLIRNVVESAVLSSVNTYGVYEALYEDVSTLTNEVRRQAQRALDELNSGMQIDQVVAGPVPPAPPKPVITAFQEVFNARTAMRQEMDAAQGYVNNGLSVAAGSQGRPLYDTVTRLDTARYGLKTYSDTKKEIADLEEELQALNQELQSAETAAERARLEGQRDELRALKERAEGEVQALEPQLERYRSEIEELPVVIDELFAKAGGRIATVRSAAQTYRERVVQEAKADAEAVTRLLRQFSNNDAPLAVYLDQLRLETLEEAIEQADDIYVLNPSREGQGSEVRILISPPLEMLKKRRGER